VITLRYRIVDGTNLKVSAICMGGSHLSKENEEESLFSLLDTYTECGGNFIDTANIYGKWLPCGKSVSEINIGKWIRSRQNRSNLVIATKGGHPYIKAMHIPRLSKRDIAADMDESLGSLQTDCIDLYWLHRDDETMPVGEIIEYLNEFVREGKIRHFGCSNWKTNRICEARAYAQGRKLMGFAGNQMLWNLAKLNEDPFDDKTMIAMDAEMYAEHLATGMEAFPYTSQAGGFFEKLDEQDRVPLSDALKRAYFNEENFLRYKRIKTLAAELSVPSTAIVLAYLLSQPFTTIPIIGSGSTSHLKKSMRAGDMILKEDALKYLDGGQYDRK
jgi:aryl-alcohol dehydrogenase-like predicted oxidoreductase